MTGRSASALFSARWTTRILAAEELSIVFTSDASGGSRVLFDGTVILDVWEEYGSELSSEQVSAGVGFHNVAYEYHSAETDEIPTNSFAVFTWTGFDETRLGSDDPVFADVGWFTTSANGTNTMGFQAGLIRTSDLAFDVSLAESFASSPSWLVFAGLQSNAASDKSGSLRLVDSGVATSTLAVEFSHSCDTFAAQDADRTISWVALPSDTADARVHQQSTLSSDVAALLAIAFDLRLPTYLRGWRNGTDPCATRWSGIECRAAGVGVGQAQRVVVLDIHRIDLTGHEIPWELIGQLSALEEISLWNTGLGGTISAGALCGLAALQVLALSDNKIRGILPPCMADLQLIDWLYVDNNLLHGKTQNSLNVLFLLISETHVGIWRTGPITELSGLGRSLKNVASKSLAGNRWAPLLPKEKQTLLEVSEPIGMVEGDRDWDFRQRYVWEDRMAQPQEVFTAEREISYRRWKARAQQPDLSFALPFELPYRGRRLKSFIVGQDGRFQDIVSSHFDAPTRLVSDTLIDTIDHLPDTYTVSVEITPTGDTIGQLGNIWTDWGSILRLTTTETNCCHPGDHILALWFDPGSLRLSLALSWEGQVGGDWPSIHRLFSDPLPGGEPTLTEIEFTREGCTAFVGGIKKLVVPISDFGPRVSTVFTDNVKLYAAEPSSYQPAALASIRDLRVDIGRRYWVSQSPDHIISRHFEEPFTLVSDNLVEIIGHLPDTYTVSVEITPTNGTVGSYASILRLTTTDNNCCAPGDVILGVWFAPDSLQLRLGLSKADGSFPGWPHVLNQTPLPIGEPTLLEVQFTSDGCNAKLDGIQKLFVPIQEFGPREGTALTDNVKLYAAEPASFWPAARASIRNLQIAIQSPAGGSGDEVHDSAAQTLSCWADISAVVPSSQAFGDTGDSSVSSQGAGYFAERFCPSWGKFVTANTCSESDPQCDASGTAIYDGGDDMYGEQQLLH